MPPSKLVLTAAVAVLAAVLAPACGFPRPADVGGVGDDGGAAACCVTPAECAQIGASSPQPCPLGACVHNACTTTAGACDGDEDCGGATPVCAGQVCSVCRSSASCPADAPVCDDTSHDCRACAKDSECASGACDLAAGTCVDRGAILYASPAGGIADPCTMASPCSLGHAADLVDADHAYVVLLPGRHSGGALFDAKKATIVGGGATLYIIDRSSSTINIINGSSIRIRDLQVEDHFIDPPTEPGSAIQSNDSTLAIDNLHADTTYVRPIGSGTSTPGTALTIIHSDLHHPGFDILIASGGGLIIDECTFSGGFISVSGAAEINNSIFLSNVNSQVLSFRAVDQNSTHSEVANNTFIGGRVFCDLNNFEHRHFVDNIFYNHGTMESSTSCEYDYNVILPGLDVGGTGNMASDPLFVDATHNDFHLSPGSPAINAGDPAALPTAHDFDGNLRPQGGRVDIGAFEHVP